MRRVEQKKQQSTHVSLQSSLAHRVKTDLDRLGVDGSHVTPCPDMVGLFAR